MRKSIPILLATISIFSLSGCAGQINQTMQSWMGHHYSELIGSWGPPQQVFDDGRSGRILIWTQVRSYTSPGTSTTQTYGQATAYDDYIWGSATSHTTYTPPQTYGYTAYRMFYIDKDGLIYNWTWRGL